MLGGDVLFLNLAEGDAEGGERFAELFEGFGALRLAAGELFDGLLAGLLFVVEGAAIFQQNKFFGSEAAGLIEEILQLALEDGQLAAEGGLLIGVLGETAGEFDFSGIELIDGVAQFVLGLLEGFGLFGAGIQLRAEVGDAAVGVGNLKREGFQLGAAGDQAHGGGERTSAEGAVGFEDLAVGGDVAEAGEGALVEGDGVGEGIDDDGAAEEVVGDGGIGWLEADEIDGEADGLGMLVPVVIGG